MGLFKVYLNMTLQNENGANNGQMLTLDGGLDGKYVFSTNDCIGKGSFGTIFSGTFARILGPRSKSRFRNINKYVTNDYFQQAEICARTQKSPLKWNPSRRCVCSENIETIKYWEPMVIFFFTSLKPILILIILICNFF